MGKRKRGGAVGHVPEKPSEYEDTSAARFKYNAQDLADSEDEFHTHRDEVLLRDGTEGKRRNGAQQEEDEFLEPSDEEVLGYSDDDSDDDDDFDDEAAESGEDVDGEGEVVSEAGEGGRDDAGNWGSRKSDYYNTDAITNEEEALEEEAEARRIQQRRLQKLTEADFGFDEDQWAGAKADGEEEDDKDEDGVVTEKLPRLELREGMSEAEKKALLKRRYPELDSMAKDLAGLQPLWEELKVKIKNAEADAMQSSTMPDVATVVLKTQYRALSAYLGALAMAFAVLTSTVPQTSSTENDTARPSLPMQPHELREHGVLSSVENCRTVWENVRDLGLSEEDEEDGLGIEEAIDGEDAVDEFVDTNGTRLTTRQQTKEDPALVASRARRAARLQRTEASLATLDAQLAAAAQRKPRAPTAPTFTDNAYDLGDAATPDAQTAADKARRKKSLRFYTSRIAQAANKRGSGARVDGDDDLPHRERFRDRSERLVREAEARGRKGADGDTGLDDAGSDDGGDATFETNAQRADAGSDDEYATLLHGRASAKKAEKRARNDAYNAAKAAGATVERFSAAEIGADGRREIGYKISANKGLTPHRNKLVKNPRVKKRRKYEDKTKKLRSMKATYNGGEGKGGYGGELTGIKKGLVKSVKL